MIHLNKVISRVDRYDTSRNANPRFTVTFTDGTSARTIIDGSVGYGIQNKELHGVPVAVEVDNRTGAIQYVRTMDGRFQS